MIFNLKFSLNLFYDAFNKFKIVPELLTERRKNLCSPIFFFVAVAHLFADGVKVIIDECDPFNMNICFYSAFPWKEARKMRGHPWYIIFLSHL